LAVVVGAAAASAASAVAVAMAMDAMVSKARSRAQLQLLLLFASSEGAKAGLYGVGEGDCGAGKVRIPGSAERCAGRWRHRDREACAVGWQSRGALVTA